MTSAISGSPSWRRRAARWAIQWSATLLSPKAGSPMSCPRPIPNRHAIRRDQEFFLVSFLWRGSLQGPASMVVGGEVPPPRFKSKQEKQTYEETISRCGRYRPDPRCGDSDGYHRRRHPPPTQPSGLLAVQGSERAVLRRRRIHLRQGQGRREDLRLDQSRRRSSGAVRVKDLGTRPAPASIREMLSRLVPGAGPPHVGHRG